MIKIECNFQLTKKLKTTRKNLRSLVTVTIETPSSIRTMNIRRFILAIIFKNIFEKIYLKKHAKAVEISTQKSADRRSTTESISKVSYQKLLLKFRVYSED